MPRDDDRPTTIAEILELPPSRGRQKSWIGGPFTAVVKNAREKRPRGGGPSFFTAELEDPDNPRIFIEATADVDFVKLDGELVEVTGQGISRDEYNGKAQLKMGRNAMVNILAGSRGSRSSRDDRAPARSERSAPRDRDSRDRGSQRTSAPARTASPDRGASGGTQPERPYGPAIGNALEIASRCILDEKLAVPGTAAFAELLYYVASDVLRVNEHMAKGHLAPKAKDRADPLNDPEPQDRTRDPDSERSREPEPTTTDSGNPEEDDVPF